MRRDHIFPLTDVLLAALAGAYIVSAIVNRDPASTALLARAVPFVILYLGVRALSICGGAAAAALCFIGICVWGIVESIFGISQVFGHGASRHALFALTGHFFNPGPFGGFIAVTTSLAAAYLIRFRRRWRGPYRMTMMIVAAAAFSLGVIVLPASLSRAAWLAFAVAICTALMAEKSARLWLRRHGAATVGICIVAAGLCAGAFLMKKDSAVGRMHIWNMEARAIAASPWLGNGPGLGLGAYGRAQEAFFREHLGSVSPEIVKVAGCPEYPFNEYLGIGMETGVAGLLLSLSVIISAIAGLIRRRSVFASGLVAWAVFACFSYPLSVVQTSVLAVMLLGFSGTGVQMGGRGRIIGTAAGLLLSLAAFMLLDGGFPSNKTQATGTDCRSLFADGYALSTEGRYEQSDSILVRGAELSSDPMFHVIIGKNKEARGNYAAASDEYLKAHYMVPCRLYPLVRLMRLQISTGDDESAIRTAEEIVDMPVNGRQLSMVRLHEETVQSLDSLRRL